MSATLARGTWGTYERHPLLVEDVTAGGHVGSDISADGVTDVLGAVGVELSSRVAGGLVVSGARGSDDSGVLAFHHK
jgi:hypothetical protein